MKIASFVGWNPASTAKPLLINEAATSSKARAVCPAGNSLIWMFLGFSTMSSLVAKVLLGSFNLITPAACSKRNARELFEVSSGIAIVSPSFNSLTSLIFLE